MGKRMTEVRFFTEQFPTPIGTMVLLTDDEEQVRALDWTDYAPRMNRLLRLYCGDVRQEPKGSVSHVRLAVEAYFAGALGALGGLPVRTGGTSFQREVWTALLSIPVGETTSYGRLAVRLGRPKAMRAVGMANGANPVSIIVPCHRVIGADAALTGYGGGIERKRWLLRHEGVAVNG
jgi:methylated-DNA-[protein]-cysteine S-methyltransferase